MMQPLRTTSLLMLPLAFACASDPNRRTLADLREVAPDVADARVENSLDEAMAAYRSFLEDAPESSLTPEAMRRLADLKLEKEYGILGGAGIQLPAPTTVPVARSDAPDASERSQPASIADHAESDADFERRATRQHRIAGPDVDTALELPGGEVADEAGPLEAIALYDQILGKYPNYEHNDQILYQKARAYDELGRNDEAIGVIDGLIARYPNSSFIDEVQFRRGEYYFVRRKYLDAEEAYAAVTRIGPGSEYFELALYKLGWTLYKQELHEEALHQYIALLDYKVSTGYDFDQVEDEGEESRIADTYRVISLSFSSLGGPSAVEEYFAANGSRSYEDRIYSHLGEFYLEKLRYNDAASSYQAFVDLHPLHRASPHFSMRVVEIYEAGGFPKLVLESKKRFAATYGLGAEYWRHFDVEKSPEVLSYLKSNLEDLASHYHARYQEEEQPERRTAHFEEAQRWYRGYLASFPSEPESPALNFRLADLLLEHEDFGDAAREYERCAYDYPAHEKSAAAGYAAIYAHREHQSQVSGAQEALVRQEAVASTLRFVEAFPDHEHAAVVLGAAVDDLYDMMEYERAIAIARKLIETYPDADLSVRRSAWAVVANASLDTSDYVQAEAAYSRVLEMTPEEDESRQAVVDNLAAAIYKQGEQANLAGDHRAAADHFLRIARVAPTSAIRPAAEYDAGAALIQLEDWTGAAAVLDAFRQSYPDHELHREATKQIASIYRQQGELARAAGEYERVAREAEDAELQREALLTAGELYEDSDTDRALSVYLDYVERFPEPLELAVETRFKIAQIYEKASDVANQHDQLRRIVAIDGSAGDQRTPRVRYLAARSALLLTEGLYDLFREVKLVQPFEEHLQEKQRRMDTALKGFEKLVDYEVGEVTAAATFYIAEVYSEFSTALMNSERPGDLTPAELQDYELVLEEEAFPFEERAIAVHQENLYLMDAGVYNDWIEKSLAKLATLMPGRYAKFEASAGPIDAIDSYAYRVPGASRASGDESSSEGPIDPEGAEPAPESSPEMAPESSPEMAPESSPEMPDDDAPADGSLVAG
jgi:TolA-binding protein